MTTSRRRRTRSGLTLSIDTTGARGRVTLTDEGGNVCARRTFGGGAVAPRPGALLRTIDRALLACGARMGDVRAIDVVPGPGRFSGVRLGVVTANALAFALDVQLLVRGVRVDCAIPEYGAEPSITTPTKRCG